MAEFELVPHPAQAAPRVTIRVSLSRVSAGLSVRFDLNGALHELVWPACLEEEFLQRDGRRDELWRSTCCEVFLAPPESAAYREVNWSPSGAWAVYDFQDYRSPAAVAKPELMLPRTRVRPRADTLSLEGMIPVTSLFPGAAIGVSMVLADTSGVCSYWALLHPAPKPDFHQRQGFILNLDEI